MDGEDWWMLGILCGIIAVILCVVALGFHLSDKSYREHCHSRGGGVSYSGSGDSFCVAPDGRPVTW